MMFNHKLWIKVVPQIIKNLIITLHDCKATFEHVGARDELTIYDVTFFNLDMKNSTSMYRIQINTQHNTKDIYIAKDNMLEFTIHFLR